MNHLITFVLIASTMLVACGGAVATPQITPALVAPTAPPAATVEPTATAHPTKLMGGCEPFEYDGVVYDLTQQDQIVDFRGQLRVVIVTCIVDKPMLVDAHAKPDCPLDADIEFDTFGGGSCSYVEHFGNMDAFVWNSWPMAEPQWPQGAPSAGPNEFPDEMPAPKWIYPNTGPQA